jgi:hypothetical protein
VIRFVVSNPNSEVKVECGAAARGAHAAGVRFSAARRKSRPPNFFAPKSVKACETKVWASRPNRHAGRVRYPFYFGVRVKTTFSLCAPGVRGFNSVNEKYPGIYLD